MTFIVQYLRDRDGCFPLVIHRKHTPHVFDFGVITEQLQLLVVLAAFDFIRIGRCPLPRSSLSRLGLAVDNVQRTRHVFRVIEFTQHRKHDATGGGS